MFSNKLSFQKIDIFQDLFVSPSKKNFDDAKSFCEQNGGKMYEPRDMDIIHYATHYLSEKDTGPARIGLKKQGDL